MKRPLFDMIDRQIIFDNSTFYASRMQLAIATARFKREIGRIIEPALLLIIKWLDKIIAKFG